MPWWAAAAVADGAGSTFKSEDGAQLAVKSFHATFGPVAAADPGIAGVDRDRLTSWVGNLREQIAAMAEADGHTSSDYACTFLGAVVGPARAVFLQIGDGAIVVADIHGGEYAWMFWPQHGEFANSTNFFTQQDFAEALEVEVVEGQLTEIALFSDGIERLVLDLANRTVHSPALRPIFSWLATTDPGTGTGTTAIWSSAKMPPSG